MEKQKLFIKIAYWLVGLSILVLIGLNIFQHQQIKKVSENEISETATKDELSAGEVTPAPAQTPEKEGFRNGSPATDEVEELEYQLRASEEELDMAHEQLSEEVIKQQENAKKRIELQKKMLQDPAYQKVLRRTYKGVIDSMYGSLYNKLDLSEEKQDELNGLLLDQMMASLDISQEMLGISPSEEKRAELQKRIDNFKEENDEKIGELLGNSGFQVYDSYRKSISERQTVQMFGDSLDESDKLTEMQKESLIDAMYEERKNVYSEQGWEEDRLTFPWETDDEGISIMMEMMGRTHEGYIKSAGSALSASQLEQFKAYLNNQRDMTESALEVNAGMYGTGTSQGNPEE